MSEVSAAMASSPEMKRCGLCAAISTGTPNSRRTSAGLDDGSLPEFFRYMIDAAAMDFGASTDHQAGGSDYWNFLTLKMADMYHFPKRFVPLYAYERNIANPDGHRNIIHTGRNYPIVPFFQKMDPKFLLPDTADGELLTFNSLTFGGSI